LTDDQILDLVQQARDEGVALGLALVEFLTTKKHSTGAVRAMATYLTLDEAKQIVAMQTEAVKKLQSSRRALAAQAGRSEGGILLPPSGLLVPRG
jgi:hypothetical protein